MLNNQRVFSKKHLILIPFAIILIILFISCDKDDDSSNLIISQARLAADRAVQYIVKNTETDGRFVYRNSIDPEIQVDESYNILRHAGTIYAMCGYYDVYPNDELKAAILLAGSYLQNVAIKPLPEADNDGQSMLAVWSGPEIDMYGKDRAKLGGTGLGLVALSCIENIQPGFTSQETLESLARFIKFMQMDDGSFYSFYTPAYGGKDNSHISLFYPGEAMLGLVMLYELYPSKEWLDVVSRGLTYLGESRAGSDSIPADHWAMIASAKLLSTELQHTLEISEELIISHGIQVSTTILNKQVYKQAIL